MIGCHDKWIRGSAIVCIALGLVAQARASPSGRVVAACLVRAQASLARHAPRFVALEAELALEAPGSEGRGPVAPAFAPFEGRWRGRWGDVPTRHLWRSVDATDQLVVIRDGALLRRGLNRAEPDGTLCGLVEEPDGGLRRHRGVTLGAPARGLAWLTPWARYDESVTSSPAGPRYRIVEHPHRPGRVGQSTVYRPWHPTRPPARHVELGAMRVDWTIDAGRAHFVLRGPTTGWVALAIGRTRTLPGSRVFLGGVVDGRPRVEAHEAVPGGHHAVSEDVRDVAGRERRDTAETVVSFSVPLDPIAQDRLVLRPGARYRFWLAWSHHDGFARHSAWRRHTDATL